MQRRTWILWCWVLIAALMCTVGCPKQGGTTGPDWSSDGLPPDVVETLELGPAPDLAAMSISLSEIAAAETLRLESKIRVDSDIAITMDYGKTEVIRGKRKDIKGLVNFQLVVKETADGNRLTVFYNEEEGNISPSLWSGMLAFSAVPILDTEGKVRRIDLSDGTDAETLLDRNVDDPAALLESGFTDLWWTLAGILDGQEITVGERTELRIPALLMASIGIEIEADLMYNVLGRVGCDGAEGSDCIMAEATLAADPEQLKARAVEHLNLAGMSTASEQLKDIDLRIDLLIIAEPETLMPHRIDQRIRAFSAYTEQGPLVFLERRDFSLAAP